MRARLPVRLRLVLPIVATLCAPCASAAQSNNPLNRLPDPRSRPSRQAKQEEVTREHYSAYLRLLEGYRVYDETRVHELGVFWAQLFAYADPLTIGLLLNKVPIELTPLSAMALTDLALADFQQDHKEIANKYLGMAETFVNLALTNPLVQPDPAAYERRRRFARDWYLLVIWLRFARAEQKEVATILTHAREKFPDDPQVLLSSGTYEELLLKGYRLEHQHTYGMREVYRQAISTRVKRAASYFRASIARDPNATEARIRLAYVLMQDTYADRNEALALLQEAHAIVKKPPLSYLAALFAGSIEEDRQNLDAASTWYRQAVADCPRAQTARLALSHLQLDQTSNARIAQNTLRPLIGGPPPDDGACEPDPWRMYEYGQAWWLKDHLEMMRTQVRDVPAKSEQP